jgi:hypothetical protein
MPKNPNLIDRAELHAVLDVWIDRILADDGDGDLKTTLLGSCRNNVGLLIVVNHSEKSVPVSRVTETLMKMGQLLITRGRSEEAPITRDTETPRQVEGRRSHFVEGRKPSQN